MEAIWTQSELKIIEDLTAANIQPKNTGRANWGKISRPHLILIKFHVPMLVFRTCMLFLIPVMLITCDIYCTWDWIVTSFQLSAHHWPSSEMATLGATSPITGMCCGLNIFHNRPFGKSCLRLSEVTLPLAMGSGGGGGKGAHRCLCEVVGVSDKICSIMKVKLAFCMGKLRVKWLKTGAFPQHIPVPVLLTLGSAPPPALHCWLEQQAVVEPLKPLVSPHLSQGMTQNYASLLYL